MIDVKEVLSPLVNGALRWQICHETGIDRGDAYARQYRFCGSDFRAEPGPLR